MNYPMFAMVTYGDNPRTHAVRQGGGPLCNSIGERKVLRVTHPATPAAMPDCSYCRAIIIDWITANAVQEQRAA
jgi:hypothetical protein